MTFFHLGASYGLNKSNAFGTVVKLEDILIHSGYFRLDGKRILLSDKCVKAIIVDVTETPAQCSPKKDETKKGKTVFQTKTKI